MTLQKKTTLTTNLELGHIFNSIFFSFKKSDKYVISHMYEYKP